MTVIRMLQFINVHAPCTTMTMRLHGTVRQRYGNVFLTATVGGGLRRVHSKLMTSL